LPFKELRHSQDGVPAVLYRHIQGVRRNAAGQHADVTADQLRFAVTEHGAARLIAFNKPAGDGIGNQDAIMDRIEEIAERFIVKDQVHGENPLVRKKPEDSALKLRRSVSECVQHLKRTSIAYQFPKRLRFLPAS